VATALIHAERSAPVFGAVVLTDEQMAQIRGGWGACSCGGWSCQTPNCPKSACNGSNAPFCYDVDPNDRCTPTGDCTSKQCRDNVTYAVCNDDDNSTCSVSGPNCIAIGNYCNSGRKKSCTAGCCGNPEPPYYCGHQLCSCVASYQGNCHCALSGDDCQCYDR